MSTTKPTPKSKLHSSPAASPAKKTGAANFVQEDKKDNREFMMTVAAITLGLLVLLYFLFRSTVG